MNLRFVISPAALGALTVLLAACSSAKPAASPTAKSPATSGSPVQSQTPPPTASPVAYPYPPIKPATFTTHITNPYLPWPQGTTYIFTGTRDGKPLRIEVAITKETKVIMGVRCLVVRDIVSGALDERTTDWYAQDNKGNVWYFGEDTKDYVNGVVSSTQGTWEAGVNGALPGIVMYAKPKPGPAYLQEYRPGVALDMASVAQTSASLTVPAGDYRHVIVTRDTDPLNPTKLEHKYYVRGIGLAKTAGVVNGHHEIVQLTQILKAK